MKQEILEKIEKLYGLEKHQEIIDIIEALPAEQLNTDLIGQLGRAYNNVKNYEKALELLKTIEFEEGHSFLWNYRAGYSYFFLEDYTNAEKCFLKAYKLDPNYKDTCDFLISTYTILANLEVKNENSEKAVEYALEAKKYAYDEERIVDTDSFLAWLYDRYKEYTKAEEILRNQLAKNKDDEWTLTELGYCLSEQEKYEEALEYLERLNELGEENDTWINTEYGFCLSRLGRYEEAIERINRALEVEDEDERDLVFIYSQLGWCHRQLGNYKKALEYYLRSKEEGRNDPWINVEIAMCYENLGDYEKGLEYALIAYELDREDIGSLSEVGLIYDRMNKYEDGLPFLLRAEELGRDDEELNTEIAINLGRSGKISEGIERLKKSLTMVDEDNNSQKIFINSEIAWLYRLKENQPEEALKYLNVAKDLGRADAWIFEMKGIMLLDLKRYEEALEHFEKAIELGRADAWIFEVKGIILLDLKRYEEAIESFKKAYAEDNNRWYLYSMGRCLRGLERYEEAIEILLKSRQISLDEEDVVDGKDFELAYCYIGIGDKENAQKYLDSARDSITERGLLNDYFEEKIEEIEKGISSLDTLFN